MLARVHLVRHGEAENPRNVVYGCLPGFGLSARGTAQARAAADQLATLVEGPAAIVTSPLDRAHQTASIVRERLGDHVPLTTDAALIEAGAMLEGLPRRFAPWSYVRRLLDAEARAKIESPRKVLRRMVAAVRGAAELAGNRDVILVSHQFPIWMATIGLEEEHFIASNAPWLFIRRPCTPASITTLSLAEGRARVRYWEPPRGGPLSAPVS